MPREAWNACFNGTPADASEQPEAGQSNWLTILAVVAALLVGTTSLMGSLAYSFQRYFEWQIELARQISQ